MSMVKINGITYQFEGLSDEVKNHLKFMAFIDSELEQLAMRRSLLMMSREQIGQRMDKALIVESINKAPVEHDKPIQNDGVEAS